MSARPYEIHCRELKEQAEVVHEHLRTHEGERMAQETEWQQYLFSKGGEGENLKLLTQSSYYKPLATL